MTPAIENLGRLAAELELEAADPTLPEYLRLSLTRQAEQYRAAQLDGGLRPCRTINCHNFSFHDYCDRCQEEIAGEPYTFGNVLHETFLSPIGALKVLLSALAWLAVAWLTVLLFL